MASRHADKTTWHLALDTPTTAFGVLVNHAKGRQYESDSDNVDLCLSYVRTAPRTAKCFDQSFTIREECQITVCITSIQRHIPEHRKSINLSAYLVR